MSTTHVIEFSVSDLISDHEEKCGAIVDTIIDQFVPAVGETTGTNPDELAALLMIELAFQMGATHSPQSIMGMLAAVADAARAGLEAASNQENEIPDPIEQSLLDMECPIVKH